MPPAPRAREGRRPNLFFVKRSPPAPRAAGKEVPTTFEEPSTRRPAPPSACPRPALGAPGPRTPRAHPGLRGCGPSGLQAEELSPERGAQGRCLEAAAAGGWVRGQGRGSRGSRAGVSASSWACVASSVLLLSVPGRSALQPASWLPRPAPRLTPSETTQPRKAAAGAREVPPADPP